MKISYGRLMMLIALVVVSIGVFGCTQKKDVTEPMLYATITLEPQRLPTLDSLYCYELWMVEDDGGSESYTSLGKFVWDNYWSRFRNIDGDTISNVLEIPEPWLNYEYMMVTIENVEDPDPTSPSGTIILTANVSVPDPLNPVIQMHFPADFSKAIGNYSVTTPTNDSMIDVSRSTDTIHIKDTVKYDVNDERRGLWLFSRSMARIYNFDTLSIKFDSMLVDSVEDPSADDFSTTDHIGIENLPTDSIFAFPGNADTVYRVFGFDTMAHIGPQIDWKDSIDPYHVYIPKFREDASRIIDSGQISNDTIRLGWVPYYVYNTGLTDLPDIKDYGWRYNTWILFADPDPNMELPKMCAFGYEGQHRFTGDTTWKVLSLGGFFRGDSADLSNPYIDNREVPNLPGEDFVMPAAEPRFENIDFLSGGASGMYGFTGSVIVGIEPDPDLLTIDTTRNFPLFVLVDSLPSRTRWSMDTSFTFHNYQNYLPSINVRIDFRK